MLELRKDETRRHAITDEDNEKVLNLIETLDGDAKDEMADEHEASLRTALGEDVRDVGHTPRAAGRERPIGSMVLYIEFHARVSLRLDV